MIKRVLLVAAMVFSLSLPAFASPKVSYDDFTGETITEYLWGMAKASIGDYADASLIKKKASDGTMKYQVKLFTFFNNYRGDMFADAGQAKVYDKATGTWKFYDMSPVSSNCNGRGGITLIYTLPNAVVDTEKINETDNSLEWNEQQIQFRVSAHNSHGQNIVFDMKDNLTRQVEDGL